MDCLFCKIIAGEIPCQEVYRDDRVLAFRDINPKAPVHVLVIPLQHIGDMNGLVEADVGLTGHLFQTAARIAAAEGVAADGYRLIVNCGVNGGQEVGHLHLHILGGRSIGPMVSK